MSFTTQQELNGQVIIIYLKELILINLKYFTDKENNYILYNTCKPETTNNYIVAKEFVTRDCILPTNNIEQIQNTFDNMTEKLIKKQLVKFSNCSENDFSHIRVLGNFINLDEGNPVYQEGILDKEKIDKDNTLYKFGVRIECHYPITLHNFFRTPWLIIKSIFNSDSQQD